MDMFNLLIDQDNDFIMDYRPRFYRRQTTCKAWRKMLDENLKFVVTDHEKVHFEYVVPICQDWHSFQPFLDQMGYRPPGTKLVRVDDSKGYYPDNCEWAAITDDEEEDENEETE